MVNGFISSAVRNTYDINYQFISVDLSLYRLKTIYLYSVFVYNFFHISIWAS